MTTTDLVPAVPGLPAADEIDRLGRLANALGQSGMFKDARGPQGVAQAMTKMIVGASLGLSPAQAMTALHVFNGQIELSANLQAAMVREHPDYDYRTDRLDDEGCVLTFLRADGTVLGESPFTLDDARKAGLADKAVWKQYPRNMVFARAMSNGVAWYCPDVTLGIRVYSPGEVSDDETPPTLDEPPASIDVQTYDGTAVTVENAAIEPEPDPEPAPEPDHIDEQRAQALTDAFSTLGLTNARIKTFLKAAGVPAAEKIPNPAIPARVAALTILEATTLERLLEKESADQQEAHAA